MIRIYLTGFMGSGKSSLGKKLAARLGYRFIDLDEFIETEQKKSIAELFEELGEEDFRILEAEALRNTLLIPDELVVSCGGGTPCFHENMDLLNKTGLTFYLKASPAALLNRIKQGDVKRPLFEAIARENQLEFVGNLLQDREQYYAKSRFTLDALHPDIDEVIHMVQSYPLE